MRNEGLDPAGKAELAGLLMQIGFKVEALTEYLMAAQMYAERGQQDQAIKLYEKVLSIDETNQIAKRGLERVKGLTGADIDDIVARMGFDTRSTEETTAQEPPSSSRLAEPPPIMEAGPLHEEVSGQEKSPDSAIIEEEVEEALPEIKPDVEMKSTVDLSSISIMDFLSSIEPSIANAVDNQAKRDELAKFFSEEELWSEAFFEKKSVYRSNPSLEGFNELLSLLSHPEDREILVAFLVEEDGAERELKLKEVILGALAKAYDESGKFEEASDIRRRLDEMTGKKKQGPKIIGDIPELSDDKQNHPGDGKSSGPIHFI